MNNIPLFCQETGSTADVVEWLSWFFYTLSCFRFLTGQGDAQGDAWSSWNARGYLKYCCIYIGKPCNRAWHYQIQYCLVCAGPRAWYNDEELRLPVDAGHARLRTIGLSPWAYCTSAKGNIDSINTVVSQLGAAKGGMSDISYLVCHAVQ